MEMPWKGILCIASKMSRLTHTCTHTHVHTLKTKSMSFSIQFAYFKFNFQYKSNYFLTLVNARGHMKRFAGGGKKD